MCKDRDIDLWREREKELGILDSLANKWMEDGQQIKTNRTG